MRTTVEDAQEMLQNTSGGAGEDSDGEEEYNNERSLEIPSSVLCSGDKGCGEYFPMDQKGSDSRYSMLCALCYKNSTGERS